MTFLLLPLRLPLLSEPSCGEGGSVTSAKPVATMVLELVWVTADVCPLGLTVVMMVVKSWTEVETTGVVLTMAEDRRVEDASGALDEAGASGVGAALPPRVGVGVLLLLLLLLVGAGEEAGGAALVGSLEEGGGASEVLGGGVLEGGCDGCADEGRGVGVEGGGVDAGGAEEAALPVPLACRRSPWWM
jgi:hypothetical protein